MIIFIVLGFILPLIHCSYITTSSSQSADGWTATLALSAAGPYGNDVTELSLSVFYETDDRLRFRIFPSAPQTDLTFSELPNSLFAVPTPISLATQARKYNVAVSSAGQPFAISVSRVDTGVAIWQTADSATLPLVFASQYLEISNQLPMHDPYLYGLGERDESLRMKFDVPYVLFSQDVAPVNSTLNQYGVHPFYLHHDAASGESCGVLFWNAHAMEIKLTHSGTLNYKVVGGVLDFFLFLGPTPANVVSQYSELVGRPRLPPLWSLGFHQCRWGYETANDTRKMVEQYIQNGLPLDAAWNDIDYMHHYNDFTLDPYRFSINDSTSFDQWLVAVHKHHVYIVDPAIPVADYPPYHSGLDQNIFAMRNNQSAPVWSKVWPPQPVVFPDFTNPSTSPWWQANIQRWFDLGIQADGLWIDMNEPSNFCNGEYPIGCRTVIGPPYSENSTDIPLPDQQEMVRWGMYVLQESNRTASLPFIAPTPLSNPPFIPGAASWGVKSLNENTLTMDARQNLSSLHYNSHSLYGYFESIATLKAMENIRRKRPFLLSRSTFVGSGKYTAHWTGDNTASFESMKISIPHILSFSLFAIPMVGADICGFLEDTTPELCARWMQLGSLYPFSRNHNMWNTIAQEPYALGDTVLAASLASLKQRYTILPYLYSAFVSANISGETVARPLFFEYPQDVRTFELDTQFLLGPAFMVSPVLDPGVDNVSTYVPNDDWFFFDGGARISVFDPSTRSGKQMSLHIPLFSKIPLLLRGGHIVPTMNQTMLSTHETLHASEFCLTVALRTIRGTGLDSSIRATGKLFFDDGDSLDPLNMDSQNFAFWQFVVDEAVSSTWTLHISRSKGVLAVHKRIVSISIFGVSQLIVAAWFGSDVTASAPFTYCNVTQTLIFSDLSLFLPSPTDGSVTLSWSAVPPAPSGGGGNDGLSLLMVLWITVSCIAGSALFISLYCYFKQDADGYSDLEAALISSSKAYSQSRSMPDQSIISRPDSESFPQHFLNPSTHR